MSLGGLGSIKRREEEEADEKEMGVEREGEDSHGLLWMD